MREVHTSVHVQPGEARSAQLPRVLGTLANKCPATEGPVMPRGRGTYRGIRPGGSARSGHRGGVELRLHRSLVAPAALQPSPPAEEHGHPAPPLRPACGSGAQALPASLRPGAAVPGAPHIPVASSSNLSVLLTPPRSNAPAPPGPEF